MKILIIEDDADAVEMLSLILSEYGEVDSALESPAGLQMFSEACKSDAPYGLVCLDIMMPEKSGLEILQEIRELEDSLGFGGSLGAKVVMFTALEDEETIQKALELGCEGYIFKTDGPKKIIQKLKELGILFD